MKRARTNSVTYLKTTKRARRGSATNPIVLNQRVNRAVAIAVARQGEKKGMDTDISATSIVSTTNTNANAVVLNLVQQGAGSWNRIGKQITLKSLRLMGNVRSTMVPSATFGDVQQDYIRMIVVWDKQPSGAAIPSYDTIFGITDQSGTESCPDILCPLRYDNIGRFRVLRDKVLIPELGVQGSGGSSNGVTAVCHYDEYIKLNTTTIFSGQTSPMSIADISTGALYVYFRGYYSTLNRSVDGVARLRYTD